MDLNLLFQAIVATVFVFGAIDFIIMQPLFISRCVEARKKRMTSFSSPYTFGSAHFASQEEVAELLPTPQQLTTEPCLLLGFYSTYLAALSQKRQESHVLLIAPTGQGKTSGIMLPGLLSETGARSLLINDTKFELVGQCFGWLSQHHQCHVVSPTRPESSHHYNPLAHIADMEDAEDVAACLVANTGESTEPFWNNASRLLLTASILHVKAIDQDAPFSALITIITPSMLMCIS